MLVQRPWLTQEVRTLPVLSKVADLSSKSEVSGVAVFFVPPAPPFLIGLQMTTRKKPFGNSTPFPKLAQSQPFPEDDCEIAT